MKLSPWFGKTEVIPAVSRQLSPDGTRNHGFDVVDQVSGA